MAGLYHIEMSKATVMVTLVIALVLGLAVVLTTPSAIDGLDARAGGAVGAEGSARVLEFDPAKVVSIRVQTPARDDVLRRREGTGEWWLATSAATGSGDASGAEGWPVSVSSVRALLRMLSTIDASAQGGESASAATTASLGPEATLIELALESGQLVRARLGTQPLGGRVPIEIMESGSAPSGAKPSRRAWVSSDLHESLAVAGPRAWRDPTALLGVGPEVARVSISRPSDAGPSTIRLARVQGRWGMVEPIVHALDEQAVGQLLGVLGGLRVAEFLDDRPADAEAFKGPTLSITTEVDQRSIEGESARTTVITRTLTIGSQAGLGETRLHARLVTSRSSSHADAGGSSQGQMGENSAEFLIDPATLERLPVDPAMLLAKTAISRPAVEIDGFSIGVLEGQTARWVRSGGGSGWESLRPAMAAAPATPSDAEQLQAIAALLSATPADRVTIQPLPKLSSSVRIGVESASGTSLATLTLGRLEMAEGQPPVLAIHDGEVLRVYGQASASEMLEWVLGQGAGEKPANQPPRPVPAAGPKGSKK
jgi:hypothetical protein